MTAIIFLALGACATSSQPFYAAVEVPAAAETEAVATANADAADDPAIWAAAPGTTVSFGGRQVGGFVAGTDKKAGLYVYGLDGRQLQFLPDGLLNNVDLREAVPVEGRPQVVLAASDRGRMGVALYLFDPAGAGDNRVRPWGFVPSDVGEPYGICVGRAGEELRVILIGKDGAARMYAITLEATPRATEIARFALGGQSEGCVIDEEGGHVYVGEEGRGLWRYAFSDPSVPQLIEPVGEGRLVADVEGVTMIRDGGARYLIVSSQGDSAFAVWRIDGAAPAYVGRFRVAAAGTIDPVTGTDGVDARGGGVGPFPEGVVAVQDDQNEGAQNFKLIDWREIRRALGLAISSQAQ